MEKLTGSELSQRINVKQLAELKRVENTYNRLVSDNLAGKISNSLITSFSDSGCIWKKGCELKEN